jgi:hypothetical protein
LDEPTFDLPEPDGKMIWRIGQQSDRVAGFAIVGAKEGALSAIGIEFIVRRKKDIESRLPRFLGAFARGRVTRHLIDEIVVTALTDNQGGPENASPGEDARRGEEAWNGIVERLSALTTA